MGMLVYSWVLNWKLDNYRSITLFQTLCEICNLVLYVGWKTTLNKMDYFLTCSLVSKRGQDVPKDHLLF